MARILSALALRAVLMAKPGKTQAAEMPSGSAAPAPAPAADDTAAPAPAPAPAAAGQKITPISKLSVKTVCGTPETSKLPQLRVNISDANPDGDPNPEAELRIMRVAGYANATKSGQSTYGQWKALAGQFSAVNYGSGEIFMSANCILPGSMNDTLYDTVNDRLKEDAGSQVAFKVDVFVKRSARDKNKYEYVVRPVIETEFKSPALALLTAD